MNDAVLYRCLVKAVLAMLTYEFLRGGRFGIAAKGPIGSLGEFDLEARS